jgi:hypothetical protein
MTPLGCAAYQGWDIDVDALQLWLSQNLLILILRQGSGQRTLAGGHGDPDAA